MVLDVIRKYHKRPKASKAMAEDKISLDQVLTDQVKIDDI